MLFNKYCQILPSRVYMMYMFTISVWKYISLQLHYRGYYQLFQLVLIWWVQKYPPCWFMFPLITWSWTWDLCDKRGICRIHQYPNTAQPSQIRVASLRVITSHRAPLGRLEKGASSPRHVTSICWKSVIIHWLLDILSQSREMEQIYKSTVSKRWLAPPCWGGALLQCTTCPTVWSHPALTSEQSLWVQSPRLYPLAETWCE